MKVSTRSSVRSWSWLSLVLVSFAPPVMADFDGRLPIGKGRLVYHGGKHIPPRADLFWRENGSDFVVYWDDLLGTPRYVSPRKRLQLVSPKATDEEGLKGAVARLINRNAEFLGTEAARLLGPTVRRVDRSWLLIYRQAVSGIPIRGSSLRVMVSEDGALQSLKAFILRDPPPVEVEFVPFDVLRPRLEEMSFQVTHSEPQLYFPRYDPGSLTPVWMVRGADPGGSPRECFFDPRTGRLREERELVFELGPVTGQVTGFYPDPNDLFATPAKLPKPGEPLPPLAGVVIEEDPAPVIGRVIADSNGDFDLTVQGNVGDTVALEARLEYGQCSLNDPSCLSEYKPLLQVLGREVNFCTFSVQADLDDNLVRASGRGTVGHGTGINFNDVFKPSLVTSLQLMGFHHLRKFLVESQERIQSNNLFSIDAFPLRLVVPNDDDEFRRMRYFPSATDPSICFTVLVEGAQYMTPTLINHEYAHHLVFILTRTLQSQPIDCFPEEAVCVENSIDPRERMEAMTIEGVSDALAAMHVGLPVFGYVASGVPGARGYDISEVTGTRDETREEVAKALWDLFVAFRAKDRVNLVNDLVHRWLASNHSTDGSDRIFDGSQTLMDEILDTLDAAGFGDYGDGDRSTISDHDKIVVEAFAGRQVFYAPFIRGDSDQSLKVDLSDAIYTLNYLFLGNRDERCLDAMDVDDNDEVVLTDPIVLLQYLFLGGAPPNEPFDACDVDQDPLNERLRCKLFACKL